MIIRMTRTIFGSDKTPEGVTKTPKSYTKGESYDVHEDYAATLLRMGAAVEEKDHKMKDGAPENKAAPKKKASKKKASKKKES